MTKAMNTTASPAIAADATANATFSTTTIPTLLDAERANEVIARPRAGSEEDAAGQRRGGMWQKHGFRGDPGGARTSLVYSRRDLAIPPA